MEVIKIKPISVNEAYSGQRFKTEKLKWFKKEMALKLPKKAVPWNKIYVKIHFGFSSHGSDLDNHVKAFLDCLQIKHKFNDNKVYRLDLTKEIVSKGSEFIKYEIKEYSEFNGLIR